MSSLRFAAPTLCVVCLCAPPERVLRAEPGPVTGGGEEVVVPEAIVRRLARGEGRELTAGGLRAYMFALNRDKKPEIVVSGVNDEWCSPTGNCSHWVFVEEAPNVFRLLLEVGAAQKLDPQETPAKGYRDIVTTRHDSGFDYTVRRYRFDGSQYRPSDCVEHHYATADDDRGGRRGSRRPTVTPCGRD